MRQSQQFDDFIASGFANSSLYEDLYQKFLKDPESVDASWRAFFRELDGNRISRVIQPHQNPQLEMPKQSQQSALSLLEQLKKRPITSARLSTDNGQDDEIRIIYLIETYRIYGHLLAKINPIEAKPRPFPHALQLSVLGFHDHDLDRLYPTCGLSNAKELPLREIIEILQEIYCGSIGVEYMGMQSPELEAWLQQKIEPNRFKIDLSIEQKQLILEQLNKSGLFEWFLQTKYVGQKRFSLEGAETLIPMMAAIVETGSDLGMEEFVVGMAHRGRLNVLCNILDKSYSDIFSEFEEGQLTETLSGSGDVKYHKGFNSEITTNHGKKIRISITPNPSHLESVNPVVEGQTRAKQTLVDDLKLKERVVPILIHGDAALSGQGVVYETMQFGKLDGYGTGGTIHLVINNQIGFTTIPEDSRSTPYCTDIAKAFGAPVFHVNAEDPEACVYATILAVELRQIFHCDVFIDLICYRKYGHNESDEPAFTQPLEYHVIREKLSIRELYREHLIHEGVLEKYLAEQLEAEFKKGLQLALQGMKEIVAKPSNDTPPRPAENSEIFFDTVKTGVSLKVLEQVANAISTVPRGFTIHPKLLQIIKERKLMVTESGSNPLLDWGMAELLAYGTLLLEGTSIRISGQDSCRGTFSHRHAVWMDQKEERGYFPLQHLSNTQGRFDVYNSPLSEMAVLGFEYGYSTAMPQSMVIWEAQFGDFSNGAQVVIDQYISTGEQKWGKTSNLILYLPHGFEGQGPEHSSGRMERFLILCGENNMVVVNPTTPAQLFHLLRRHIRRAIAKPLIVYTPKGLLRHPLCVSKVSELIDGAFEDILDDPEPPSVVRRLGLCSGRIYYDLIEERKKREKSDIAFVRIEQLYPFDQEKLRAIIESYGLVREVFWIQEEPKNMGAWGFISSRIQELLPDRLNLAYIGREPSASPAAGSYHRHKKELRTIMQQVFPEGKPLDIDYRMMHRV